MFKSINELFNLITVAISSLSILATAGEKRAQHLSTINDHDIEKAQVKLKTDMEAWKAKQTTKREAILSPAEFKPAASDS